MNEFVGMFQFISMRIVKLTNTQPKRRTNKKKNQGKKSEALEKDDDPIGKKPYYSTNKRDYVHDSNESNWQKNKKKNRNEEQR